MKVSTVAIALHLGMMLVALCGGCDPIMCQTDSVCSDGVWCNGVELCVPTDPMANSRGCRPTARLPCSSGNPRTACNEASNVCGSSTGTCSGDDECSDGIWCNGRERCDPVSSSADRRGCAFPRNRPCLDVQECNEAEGTCESWSSSCKSDPDVDDDNVDAAECGGLDCDDRDQNRFAGNVEVCDPAGHDEDCDASTFGDRDTDRDGFLDSACCNTDAAGARFCGLDCDDSRRAVNPGLLEMCDGLDNDCNGVVDEDVKLQGYADADHDGYGAGAPIMACLIGVGLSYLDDDCDDSNEAITPGSIRCAGALYQICRGGTWTEPLPCGGNGGCRAQPNGTGFCL